MHQSLSDLLIVLGAVVLFFSAAHDFGFRTVPNWASLALLAIGLALRTVDGGLLWGVILGAVVLLITFVIWRLGWMGGGDVKLLSAATVFVPPYLVPHLIIDTALVGGAMALVYLIAGRVVPRPAAARPHGLARRAMRAELWRLHRRGPLPYAAAIAAGGFIATMAS